MKIAVFQHEPTEPLGYLEQVFSEHTVPFEYIRLFETGEVPRTSATHLVFMGGPMSVNDEQEFPYLKAEKELIRQSVKKRQKVLGICLGAQLIASAFGAPVYHYVQETGWHELRKVPGRDGRFCPVPGYVPGLPAPWRYVCPPVRRAAALHRRPGEEPGIPCQELPRAAVPRGDDRRDHPGLEPGPQKVRPGEDRTRHAPLPGRQQPVVPGGGGGVYPAIADRIFYGFLLCENAIKKIEASIYDETTGARRLVGDRPVEQDRYMTLLKKNDS